MYAGSRSLCSTFHCSIGTVVDISWKTTCVWDRRLTTKTVRARVNRMGQHTRQRANVSAPVELLLLAPDWGRIGSLMSLRIANETTRNGAQSSVIEDQPYDFPPARQDQSPLSRRQNHVTHRHAEEQLTRCALLSRPRSRRLHDVQFHFTHDSLEAQQKPVVGSLPS
jgi:hypothetical protein